MSGGSLSPERFAEDIAEALRSFDVIRSDDTTLLIDIDTPEAKAQFERVFPKVDAVFGIDRLATWKSKSGNTHYMAGLKVHLPPAVRLALQAALGSDGVREALALGRLMAGCIEPSALFRPKGAEVTNLV